MSSFLVKANDKDVFDEPVDCRNVLNVMNKNRVRINVERRKPTRFRSTSHSEIGTKTSFEIPMKSDEDASSQNSDNLLPNTKIKTTIESEPAKLDYKGQEKKRMNLMSKLISEASTKVSLKNTSQKEKDSVLSTEKEKKNSLEFDDSQENEVSKSSDCQTVLIEIDGKPRNRIEAAAKDKSREFLDGNLKESTSLVQEEQNLLLVSNDISDNNLPKSNNFEVAPEVIWTNVEENISQTSKIEAKNKSEEIFDHNSKNNTMDFVDKNQNNLFVSHVIRNNNVPKCNKFEVEQNNLLKFDKIEASASKSNNLEVALTKASENENKNSIIETAKNNNSKFLDQNHKDRLIESAFLVIKEQNSLLECNVPKSKDEVAAKFVLKEAIEVQNDRINEISELTSEDKLKNIISSQTSEEKSVSFACTDNKKSETKQHNFEESNITKSDHSEDSVLMESDNSEEDFHNESICQNLLNDVEASIFLGQIFKSSAYTDVEFELKNEEGCKRFFAHKIVMSLWSSHFADRFLGFKKCKKAINIQINDVNFDAFGHMLNFMYRFKVKLKTAMEVFELYKVAAKFEVTALMKSCSLVLNRIEVLPSNVFDILKISEYIQNKSLTDQCLKVIEENTKQVIDAYELVEITPSMVHIILNSHHLSLDSEYDLLYWIFGWIKNYYLKNFEYKNTRKIFKQFLSKLNFLSLTNTEFTKLLMNLETSLTRDEIIRIFMNIAKPGSMQMPDWYNEKQQPRIFSNFTVE